MGKAKTIDFSDRPKDEKGVNPSCPVWIFGDEKSADKDMKEKFEIVDDETKD